ncbi:MAG: hypothetical protein HXY22_13500 [Alphaproteobacteria bacterium]|nr:hypothetical protein [Alphaproteobacteria bacterium]
MTTSVPVTVRDGEPFGLPAIGPEVARAIVDEAVARYFRKVRSRIPEFIARNYRLAGAMEIHRQAIGHDLWRAPLNAALVGPALMVKGVAWGVEKAGRRRTADWLRAREIFMRTDVSREIEWRLHTELFQLPHDDGDRVSRRDALGEEILRDARLLSALEALNGPWGAYERERLNQKLAESLAIYTNSRFAAGEIANAVLTAGAGAAFLHQFTPGVWTLGPGLAQVIAQKIVAGTLPFGEIIGTLWHSLTPAAPGAALTAASTTGVLAIMAVFSAVSGVITDPLQEALGINERRLLALTDALEKAFLGDENARLVARDAYAMRVAELLDWIVAAWRFAKA